MDYLDKEQKATLKRNVAAVQRAILNVRAHDKIFEADTYHKGIDFIQLAYRALFNDLTAQAINVFEGRKGGRSRSFWWLYKKKRTDINAYAKEKNIDWTLIESVSDKLRIIRNKTLFHFSREYVDDYKKAWEEAGLKGDDLLISLDYVWAMLSFLHERQYNEPLCLPDYDGEDAKKAAAFVSGLESGYGL